MSETNRLDDFKRQIIASGKSYILDPNDELTEEYAHFYFLGNYEGKQRLFDTILYTLRLQHESEIFEIAEQRAAEHFPQYKKIKYEEDEEGNLVPLSDLEEEIGLFMAEVMMELEEEGNIKLKEHIDVDATGEEVSLDIGLHIEKVTSKIIESFIRDFNSDKLNLDPTFYSFQTQAVNFKA